MRPLALAAAAVILAAAGSTGAPAAAKPGVDWPQFRGIAAAGVAEGFSLPSTWNAADGSPRPGIGVFHTMLLRTARSRRSMRSRRRLSATSV